MHKAKLISHSLVAPSKGAGGFVLIYVYPRCAAAQKPPPCVEDVIAAILQGLPGSGSRRHIVIRKRNPASPKKREWGSAIVIDSYLSSDVSKLSYLSSDVPKLWDPWLFDSKVGRTWDAGSKII